LNKNQNCSCINLVFIHPAVPGFGLPPSANTQTAEIGPGQEVVADKPKPKKRKKKKKPPAESNYCIRLLSSASCDCVIAVVYLSYLQ